LITIHPVLGRLEMVRSSAMAQALLPVHGASWGGRLEGEKTNRKAKVKFHTIAMAGSGCFYS